MERTDPSAFASSPVVTTVFDTILAQVHDGTLQPGERISDGQIAEDLGVSRTPVREAIQRLREIGIVEAAANRFTRIALVTPEQTAHAMVVWLALYGALVDEVIATVPTEVVESMRDDHQQFLDALQADVNEDVARKNADFFNHLVVISRNAVLQKAITAVVHQVRLGSLHLPGAIDLAALAKTQALMILAAQDHDTAAARGALRMISQIEVPQEG